MQGLKTPGGQASGELVDTDVRLSAQEAGL